jgi:hypothetical protein
MSQYSAIDNTSATFIERQKATDVTEVLWIVTMAIVMLS